MRRLGPGLVALIAITFTALFLAKWLGWLDFAALLNVCAAAAGLAGLVLLVKLPWDLFMQARGLVADQRDAERREIDVAESEINYAKRIARRLLVLCIALHVLTAGVVAAATWASDGYIGYWFAGFYLLSSFFRPGVALYRHLAARLSELRLRTRYPRQDVVSLGARVEDLEARAKDDRRTSRGDHSELAVAFERLSRRVDALDRDHHVRTAAFEDQVERCLRELERTVDKLTDDRELLAGIRAFVKVVKQT